jgi:gamma-butyrobetaine dioxygenase
MDRLNEEGEIVRVNYNQPTRDSHLSLFPEQVKPFYKALKLLYKNLYLPEHMISFKMQPGDCTVYDNQRVLHGRRGFNVQEKEGGHRLLIGSYMDWDEISSKINVLEKKKK